jgi:hypothetical protein
MPENISALPLGDFPSYVHDGWARYYCRLETKQRRGRPVYRYVIEREFVRRDDYRKGWWTRDRDKVIRRAASAMRALDPHKYESVQL